MYKIAFIDLDGTLLNSQKQMSEFDCLVLKKASKQIKIVFASARGYNRIKPYVEQIGTNSNSNYTLAFNGGLLINNTEEIKLIDNCINPSNLNCLLNWCNEVVSTSEIFVYTYEKSLKLQKGEVPSQTIYKVVIKDTSENILNLRNSIPNSITELFEITSSEPTRIEFVQKGITKKQAILTLLKHFNLSNKEMIAIGDGENDILMLDLAGMAIAMGNASTEVKNHANVVTDTNDNSGVGKALNKILNLGL